MVCDLLFFYVLMWFRNESGIVLDAFILLTWCVCEGI